MDTLREAFDGTGQPTPGEGGVTIWYFENGYDEGAGREGIYGRRAELVRAAAVGGRRPNRRTDADHPAPDQATQLVDALRLAYCEPYVGAYFNFLLFDENDLTGWRCNACCTATGRGSRRGRRSSLRSPKCS